MDRDGKYTGVCVPPTPASNFKLQLDPDALNSNLRLYLFFLNSIFVSLFFQSENFGFQQYQYMYSFAQYTKSSFGVVTNAITHNRPTQSDSSVTGDRGTTSLLLGEGGMLSLPLGLC